MDDTLDSTPDDTSKPIWENMVESPVIDYVSASIPLCKYKLKLKYGGIFRVAKHTSRKIYCFGSQKCIYIDTWSYNLTHLNEEVMRRYSSKGNPKVSISYVDKCARHQSFIELESDESFMAILTMYEDEKEVTLYATTDDDLGSNNLCLRNEDKTVNDDEPHDDSEYCPSEDSCYSHLSSDDEDESMNDDDDDDGEEAYSFVKNSLSMKVGTKFGRAVDFRRALNHYAVINEFDYFIQKSEPTRFTARCANMDCEWRIYASVMQDGITFEVRKIVEDHTCTRSNKGGNKRATQGWVASIVADKLKSDGNASPGWLKKWIMRSYNVDVSYSKVFRGKAQVYTDVFGKWEESFMKMEVFRKELLSRNEGSVVEIDFDVVGDKKLFKRFFVCLAACSRWFLDGCRPYISLDACHLKGKFNGVLAAATGVDGNKLIFPVAYCVLESENTQSWTWFLELLKKAIGTPTGLIISSDMQKGLEVAIMHVYPNVEHRECIRHLCSNFKKQFRGKFFSKKLWSAAKTYLPATHDRLLKEISDVSQHAITYLSNNHNKVWSRSKFGTTCKCDYITNNISESFNSWIGALRYEPVLDLLDGIREKIMKQLDKKRKLAKKWNGVLVPIAKDHVNDISKNLGEYDVSRSGDNKVEVKYKGKRWEVNLDERRCSCRVWQVTGLPCVHAAAFINYTRDVNWDKFVDSCYTIERFKKAYAFEIAPMPSSDQWMQTNGEKIYPPIVKRPVGRPKKNRIKSSGESKRRHKCPRCGEYGHREKTCKNPAPQGLDPSETSTSKGKNKCPR